MITCPKCGRPVSGRARRCGYCGQSLLHDYFQDAQQRADEIQDSRPSGGALAGVVLSGFCGLSLILALVCHLLALFGLGPGGALAPKLDLFWWVRSALMAVVPVVSVMQTMLLLGRRASLTLDAVWLFLMACGLSVTVQAYLEMGTAAFYGLMAIPYLLIVGCALGVAASVVSILSFDRPRY